MTAAAAGTREPDLDPDRLPEERGPRGRRAAGPADLRDVDDLTRDLDLTWDGGHDFPSSFAGLHVAEFHARGKIVRQTITEDAIVDSWRTDAESLAAIRRAVKELLSDEWQLSSEASQELRFDADVPATGD